ncbi:unnamed protein product, partial [Polarella glacialis]
RVTAAALAAKAESTEAITVLREAIEIARSVEDRKAEASVLLRIAGLELDPLRRLDDCRATAAEAQALFREVEHWRGEADVVELQLRLEIKEGSRQAENLADEWRALFFDAGDRKGEAHCVKEAARMFCEAGFAQEAESRAQEAQALYQEMEDQPGEASALLALAEVLATFGDVQRGVQAAEEALELSKLLEDPQGQAAAWSALAKVQMMDGGDPEEACTAAEKAVSLVKRALKGWATRRDEVKALQLLSEAGVAKLLKIADQNGDPDQEPDAAEKALLQTIFDKAMKAVELAVDHAMNMDDRRLQASTLHTLARGHLVCRSQVGATDAAREGLRLAREIHDRSLEASFLMVNAEVHIADNYLGKADEEARAALAIFRDLRDSEGEEYAKSVLDDMYGTTRGGQGTSAPDASKYEDSSKVQAASESSVVVNQGPTKEYIIESLQVLSKNVVGDDVEIDSPLMEAGMDSLSSVEFRNQVRGLVPGVNLPASIVFDYPSLRSMTDFIHMKASEQ